MASNDLGHAVELGARVTRAALGLGVNLALTPVRLALRAVVPSSPEPRWEPVPGPGSTPSESDRAPASESAPTVRAARAAAAAAGPGGGGPAASAGAPARPARPARSTRTASPARSRPRRARMGPAGGNGAPPATGRAPGAARSPAEPVAAPAPTPARSDDLTSAEAARRREAEREAQTTPASPGPEIRVDEPWEGYDAMNVAAVIGRLRGASPTVVAMVRLYEETHKKRIGVIRAAGGE
jgi:hypothetical protein